MSEAGLGGTETGWDNAGPVGAITAAAIAGTAFALVVARGESTRRGPSQ